MYVISWFYLVSASKTPTVLQRLITELHEKERFNVVVYAIIFLEIFYNASLRTDQTNPAHVQ
jgi:hypothetical protein